eukprot:TRINITY_DN18220_c0_g1_i1.p1 TRINITY_DN18220_c0_g1~~TRINITY_DN18220_c0_g1_i1.p1  ORF type:complete len:528 (+),score=149.30 TRINITY_DN18220_c0_g1_i1:34-1584(+)
MMEYVEGISLGEHVRNISTILDENVAAHLIRQILQALVFLHNNDVIHRDIKADNILITEDRSAKLCDFGTLKNLVAGSPRHKTVTTFFTQENTLVGSPHWMAPEVLKSGDDFVEVGPPADVYSLGCTVSEVLNQGVPPGRANIGLDWLGLVAAAKTRSNNIAQNISPDAEDFIRSCMQLMPSNRPTSAELLEHPFVTAWTTIDMSTWALSSQGSPHHAWLSQDEMRGRTVMRPSLGKGSFGVVFRAKIHHRSEHVAVKEIYLETSHSAKARMRAEQEFSLMCTLHHPHIVQYLGHLWRDASCLEIFMEYMSGGSVRSHLKALKRPLDIPTIRRYTHQVLLGLNYLHTGETTRQPIAHRDVKADNLLLSLGATVKLSDFGCSKLFEEVGEEENNTFGAWGARTCVGTPLWMAPEVLQSQQRLAKDYGTRCDVWSLGCTVIEMLGSTPWRQSGTSESELRCKMQSEATPPIPAATPEDLVQFLNRCFVYDPTQRAAASALLDDPFITCSDDDVVCIAD